MNTGRLQHAVEPNVVHEAALVVDVAATDEEFTCQVTTSRCMPANDVTMDSRHSSGAGTACSATSSPGGSVSNRASFRAVVRWSPGR